MDNIYVSLIICTYNRPKSIQGLLDCLANISCKPDEIIIIDGSTNQSTAKLISDRKYALNISYHLVAADVRGLTRQRNYGINHISDQSDVVAFLDDDVIVDDCYFGELKEFYKNHPKALGMGGYVTNEVKWEQVELNYTCSYFEFCWEGWKRREQGRMVIRKLLGLYPKCNPGEHSSFAHSLSLGYIPPSGRVYQVNFLIGCTMSFRKSIFKDITFSEYFDGYGLYEDMDFSLRASRIGKLYINTKATLCHYHEPAGRPNQFKFGVMVIRNGWYVWRVGNRSPTFMDVYKWWMTTITLALFKLISLFSGPNRVQALTEFFGRAAGIISLGFRKPKRNN